MVRGGGVDTVLVGDDLPELGADLVAALAALMRPISCGSEGGARDGRQLLYILHSGERGRQTGGRGFAALRREGVVRGRRRPVPHYTTAIGGQSLEGGLSGACNVA